MAAYKDEERGTWYVSFHYNDWTGKNKRKLKRGFKTRKEATGVGAEVPTPAGNQPGYGFWFILQDL